VGEQQPIGWFVDTMRFPLIGKNRSKKGIPCENGSILTD
jgi:hypothetical protein